MTWDAAVTPEELRDVPPGGIAVRRRRRSRPTPHPAARWMSTCAVSMEDVGRDRGSDGDDRRRGFDQYFPFIAARPPE
ncbi:MAG: hypothetical protein R3A10_17935 [Caldilineaceae bacterium]